MCTYGFSEIQVWDTLFLMVGMVATYCLPKAVQLHNDEAVIIYAVAQGTSV
jgi:hypothetical protein